MTDEVELLLDKIRRCFFSNKWLVDLYILLSGALLTLAFAPFSHSWLGILSPVLLIIFSRTSSSRYFWRGYLYGLGFFGCSVHWVYISIHVYGNTPPWLAGSFTALFIFILALFPALVVMLTHRLADWKKPWQYCFVFACLWVVIEMLRSWLFTGFPWILMGYSQLHSPLIGYGPIVGVYGLSWLAIFSACLICLILTGRRHQRMLAATMFFILWGLGAGLQFVHWTKPAGRDINVSMVQGNIAQEVKWDPKNFQKTLQTYQDLTSPLIGNDLIIWPEAAIPLSKITVNDYLQQLNKITSENNTGLLLGIPRHAEAKSGKYYNSLQALGTAQGEYLKQHLVPFGEYLPFENLLRGVINFFDIPMSDFIPGPSDQDLVRLKNTPLAIFICYEIIYPYLVIDDLPKAQALITINDDSWFGKSIAGAQHLEMAAMRAVETGRYLIFVSNDGPTALINPQGKTLDQLPRFEKQVLTTKFTPMRGSTPWVLFGYLLFPIFLIISLIVSIVMRLIRSDFS